MKNNEYLDELKEMAGLDDADEPVENDEVLEETEKEAEPLDMDGSLEYSILLKERDMRHFLFRHTYSSLSGWFGVLISIAAMVMLAMGYKKYGSFEIIALIAMSLLFTVVQPLQLIGRARKQIKRQEMFKSPLIYNMCKDGIVIRQDEQTVNVFWQEIRKVVKTKHAVYLYTSSVRAFIYPRDQIENYDEFSKLITEKTGR